MTEALPYISEHLNWSAYRLKKTYNKDQLEKLYDQTNTAILKQWDYLHYMLATDENRVFETAKLTSLNILSGNIRQAIASENLHMGIADLINKFEELEQKNNCLRVRFYDWLASVFENWAKSLKERSFRITTPCAIKLPPPKEELDWYQVIKKKHNRKDKLTNLQYTNGQKTS